MSGEDAVPITYVVKERPVDGYMSSPADGYAVVYTTDGVAYVPVSSLEGETEESPALSADFNFRNADFRNTPTLVRISKLDASNNKEIPGASMRLIRVKTGEIVDSWISEASSHYVEALAAGEEYRLEEVSAPTGYYLADPITFTVNSDGTTQLVAMKDVPILEASH